MCAVWCPFSGAVRPESESFPLLHPPARSTARFGSHGGPVSSFSSSKWTDVGGLWLCSEGTPPPASCPRGAQVCLGAWRPSLAPVPLSTWPRCRAAGETGLLDWPQLQCGAPGHPGVFSRGGGVEQGN